MLQRLASAAVVVLVAAACGSPIAPAEHGLDGSWRGPRHAYAGDDPTQPRIVQEELSLPSGGGGADWYERRLIGYGAYGRPITERTSQTWETGTYTVADGEIRFLKQNFYVQDVGSAPSGAGGSVTGTYIAKYERGEHTLLLHWVEPQEGYPQPSAVEYHRAGSLY